MFETLAKQLFPKPQDEMGCLKRLRRLLKSWYRDGIYDANILESCLKENLGSTSPFSAILTRLSPQRLVLRQPPLMMAFHFY